MNKMNPNDKKEELIDYSYLTREKILEVAERYGLKLDYNLEPGLYSGGKKVEIEELFPELTELNKWNTEEKLIKTVNFLKEICKEYDEIAYSDHPIIHASSVEMVISDFLSDEFGWVEEE